MVRGAASKARKRGWRTNIDTTAVEDAVAVASLNDSISHLSDSSLFYEDTGTGTAAFPPANTRAGRKARARAATELTGTATVRAMNATHAAPHRSRLASSKSSVLNSRITKSAASSAKKTSSVASGQKSPATGVDPKKSLSGPVLKPGEGSGLDDLADEAVQKTLAGLSQEEQEQLWTGIWEAGLLLAELHDSWVRLLREYGQLEPLIRHLSPIASASKDAQTLLNTISSIRDTAAASSSAGNLTPATSPSQQVRDLPPTAEALIRPAPEIEPGMRARPKLRDHHVERNKNAPNTQYSNTAVREVRRGMGLEAADTARYDLWATDSKPQGWANATSEAAAKAAIREAGAGRIVGKPAGPKFVPGGENPWIEDRVKPQVVLRKGRQAAAPPKAAATYSAVLPPSSGEAYNPSFDAWKAQQAAIAKAVDRVDRVEVRAEKRLQVDPEVRRKAGISVDDHIGIDFRGVADMEFDPEENEADMVPLSDPEDKPAPPAYIPPKERRRRAEILARARARVKAKKANKPGPKIEKIVRKVNQQSRKAEARAAARAAAREAQDARTKHIGPGRFVEDVPDALPLRSIPANLTQLPATGSLARDRFASLTRRNLAANTVKIRGAANVGLRKIYTKPEHARAAHELAAKYGITEDGKVEWDEDAKFDVAPAKPPSLETMYRAPKTKPTRKAKNRRRVSIS